MTRKAVLERRAKNKDLAQRDLANRCAECKRALGRSAWVSASGTRFCNVDCARDAVDRTGRG